MGDKNRRRRKWGTGSISRRADGYWRGRIDAGWTSDGKRYRPEVVARSEAECKRKLARLQAQYSQLGPHSLQERALTVRSWFENRWLETKINLSVNSRKSYEVAIRRWIIPVLGRRAISDLASDDVRRLMREVRDAGGSTNYANQIKQTFLNGLRDAQREGMAVPPAIFSVRHYETAPATRQAIPLDAVHALLDASRHVYAGSRWYVAFMYGLRPAEGAGLEDTQINFAEKTVSIDWQLQRIPYLDRIAGTFNIPEKSEPRHLEGAVHLVRPKTRATRRTLPFIGEMEERLTLWMLEREATIHGLVWPYRKDSRLYLRQPRYDLADFQSLQEVAGVSKPAGGFYTPHEIRHTTVTLLNQMGVDSPTIAAIVGHGSIQSQATYMHVPEAHLTEVITEYGNSLLG